MDFAQDNNINCGGYCPKGRIAEDGVIADKYPLTETATNTYKERTKLNIEGSDGTLVLVDRFIDQGTRTTILLANQRHKPLYLLHLREAHTAREIIHWLNGNNIHVLNIAGPRESNSPGIYKLSYEFLCKLFMALPYVND